MKQQRKKQKTPNSVVNIRESSSKCLMNHCILRSIFGNLSTGDKVVAARVCWLWHDVAYESSMWRDNDLYIDMGKVDMSVMAPSLEMRKITELKLYSRPRDGATNQFLHLMLSLGPIIKSLDMSKLSSRINEQVLMRAFSWEMFFSLETLHLNCTPTNGLIKVICEHCPCLKSLHVSGCFQLTDSILTLIGKNLTALTDLELASCRPYTDAGIFNISTCLTQLTALTIDGSSITNTGVNHLAQFPLRKLSMRMCTNIDENCINALSPLRNSLKGLDISNCLNVNPNVALHYIADSGFCLTELAVGFNFDILVRIANVNTPDVINDAAIKYFLQQKAGRHLKKVQLVGKLDNFAVIAASVKKSCPELINLILEGQNILGGD